jgi:acetylornithine deacetylase/succinyl-diaminopimelate desuccinylase-like protein
MQGPFEPRIEGDRLYGRGSCDMKAGVAGMVAAAERTTGDVMLALVADEEHGSLGTSAVLERVKPRYALVGEPTWLDLVVAHRGFSVTEVEIRGRAAHSSRPQDGVNAVTHLGRLLHALEQHDAFLQAKGPHPHAGHGSVQATVVRGGDAPFILAPSATATVERRTVPGDEDDVEALVRSLGLDATCTRVMARDAWEMGSKAEALARKLPNPKRVGAPYWMESALWEAAGVPAIVYGPAGGGLHTDVEWVELSQLHAYTDALITLLG